MMKTARSLSCDAPGALPAPAQIPGLPRPGCSCRKCRRTPPQQNPAWNFSRRLYLPFLVFLLRAGLLFSQGDAPLSPLPATWDTLCERMAAFFYDGKYPQAVEYARLALEVARRDSGETSLAFGTSLDNLGVVLHHAGRLDDAMPNLLAGVEHARTHLGVEHEDYITRLSNLGMLCRDLGDYACALTRLNESVQRAERTLDSNNIYLGVLFNNLALVNEESGQYDQALRLYERALELTGRIHGKESATYALRLDNMATLWSRSGRHEQALKLREEALPVFREQLGREHPVAINAANNLASTYGHLKRYGDALSLRLEILPLAAKTLGKEHYSYLGFLTSSGFDYLRNGQYENALAAFSSALEPLERLYPNSYRTRKDCARGLAVTHRRMGNEAESARFMLLQNRYMVEELDYRFDELSHDEQLAFFGADDEIYFDQLYSYTFLHPGNPALASTAFEDNLALKGLLLGNRRRLVQSLRENPDAGIQSRFALWQELKNAVYRQYSLPPGKRDANLDSLVLQTNDLERALSRASGEFAARQPGIGWRAVQARLNPGEAVVEFCRFRFIPDIATTDSVFYVAWLVRPGDTIPQQIFLFEEKQLGNPDATRRLYEYAGQDGAPNLHRLVWKPLEPYLDHIHTIYYAPAGLLHRVNIGAIPVSREVVLAERFHLHDLVSTRQLAVSAVSGKPAGMHPAALVFGGIRYEADSLALASSNSSLSPGKNSIATFRAAAVGEMRLKKWEYLPWTLEEAGIVDQQLRKAGMEVEMRTAFGATEAVFKKRGSEVLSPKVLHLATHGYFIPDADTNAESGFHASGNPLIRSGLILAGADRVWMGGEPLPGQEDGILTAYEISQLDLRGTELVVLSACETALGDLNHTEGVFGLQRAFKIAGARYLVMSLWNVEDHATEEFMTAFYHAWLQEGEDIPTAFGSAQRRLHRQYSRPFNPFMWAGFILVE